jgi:squalene-hopene/tetraprenyl-beta-curcumene cyclase
MADSSSGPHSDANQRSSVAPNSEDEPPPSVAPQSTGTSWWFRRTGLHEAVPPLPMEAPEREETHVQRVARHLENAVNFCLDTQQPRGCWEIEPDPRMFDTALVAYALSRVEVADAATAVQSAYTWLEHRTPQDHDPVAKLLDETPWRLLRGDPGPIDLRGPTLYSNLYRRKTLLLYTLALHRGVRVLSPYMPPQLKELVKRFYERFDVIQMKRWSKVDLLAIYSILEALDGNRKMAVQAAERLAVMQSADGSFCHNPVSTAVAFLALGTALPGSPAQEKCLTHLLRVQRGDGTWRFCTSDNWDTSLTLRAYADHPLFAAEAAPRAYEYVLKAQNPDGGWGYRSDMESDNDTTPCALLALRDREDDESVHAVDKGIHYLLKLQLEDGLWNTWQSAEDLPVEDCVAHITSALATFRGTHNRSIRKAQRWLVTRYESYGRWTAGWYRNLPYGVLDVSKGLRAGHPVGFGAVRSLIALQNMDGGFPPEPGEDSTPSATGLAVAALSEHYDVHQPFLRKALDYLMDTQQPNGTWPGKPELYGPRPLVYHLPTNTHAFAGMGLMAAWRRLGHRE